MSTTTTVSPYVYLGLATLFGVAAYVVSERFRAVHGVTPWRWPSLLWAAIGFLSLLVCAVLMAIASRATKHRLEAQGSAAPWLGGAPGYGTHPGYGIHPGYGNHPGYGPPPDPGTPPPYGAPAPTPPPVAGTAAQAPPSWFPDPGGRHQFRYWDGSAWTEHVQDHGQAGKDPVPH